PGGALAVSASEPQGRLCVDGRDQRGYLRGPVRGRLLRAADGLRYRPLRESEYGPAEHRSRRGDPRCRWTRDLLRGRGLDRDLPPRLPAIRELRSCVSWLPDR